MSIQLILDNRVLGKKNNLEIVNTNSTCIYFGCFFTYWYWVWYAIIKVSVNTEGNLDDKFEQDQYARLTVGSDILNNRFEYSVVGNAQNQKGWYMNISKVSVQN